MQKKNVKFGGVIKSINANADKTVLTIGLAAETNKAIENEKMNMLLSLMYLGELVDFTGEAVQQEIPGMQKK